MNEVAWGTQMHDREPSPSPLQTTPPKNDNYAMNLQCFPSTESAKTESSTAPAISTPLIVQLQWQHIIDEQNACYTCKCIYSVLHKCTMPPSHLGINFATHARGHSYQIARRNPLFALTCEPTTNHDIIMTCA